MGECSQRGESTSFEETGGVEGRESDARKKSKEMKEDSKSCSINYAQMQGLGLKPENWSWVRSTFAHSLSRVRTS